MSIDKMAQEKSAEIIEFTGAGEPPAAPVEATGADAAQDKEAASLQIGPALAAVRLASGQSLDAVSDAIKVKRSHLEAIEAMRADRLPPLPYAAGFVKAYARHLDLDGDAAAARFRSEMAPAGAVMAEVDAPDAEAPKLAPIVAILAVMLFALWVGYQLLAGRDSPPPTRDDPVAEAVLEAAPAPAAAFDAPETEAGEVGAVATETVDPATEQPAPSVETPPDARPSNSGPVSEDPASDDRGDAARANSAPVAAETDSAPSILPQPGSDVAVAGETPAPASVAAAAPAPDVIQPARPLPRRLEASPAPEPVVTPAALRRSVAPDYPERCARGAGALESVTVAFDVSASGRVANARVVSSTNACFESEAVRTMTRWRFTPRTVNGEAAAETGKTATLNFRK